MSEFSRKTLKYIVFEIARLRTLWNNNEGFRDRIEKRYKDAKDEYISRMNLWKFEEHPIDKILEEKYAKSNEEIICKVVDVNEAFHTVGPLKGLPIEDVYDYTISNDDKIIGRTTGTSIEAKVDDQLIVKFISPRVYGVVSKVNEN